MAGPSALVAAAVSPTTGGALKVRVLWRQTTTTVGAFVENTQPVQTVNGFGNDEGLDRIFSHT